MRPAPWRVEPDRQARELAELGDELAGAVRREQPGRVVEDDPGGADLGQPLRGLDERVVPARPVEQAGVELAAGRGDGLGRDPEVARIVERIVEPERVDAARGGARDEPADEVVARRARPDEEAAAQGEHQRRPRPGANRPDPLPGALDPAPHRRVEGAAAGDLEVGVAGAVEDLRQAEELGGRHRPGERLLREDADRGVDELRHQRRTLAGKGGGTRPCRTAEIAGPRPG